MQIEINYQNQKYHTDLSEFMDISISMGGELGVRAWYLDQPEITPVVDGDFIGSVKDGSSVNFRNIFFNPHAHVTHTETMGHISETIHSINAHLKSHYFITQVVTISPEGQNGDRVITQSQISLALNGFTGKAIVIRTLPNTPAKQSTNYAHTNPCYLEEQAAIWLRENGIEHLLIDTPSVDREVDNGELKAHKAFWNYPHTNRLHCTITEFIYVPNSVPDGLYLMNLQTAPIENDATPSRPILHQLKKN